MASYSFQDLLEQLAKEVTRVSHLGIVASRPHIRAPPPTGEVDDTVPIEAHAGTVPACASIGGAMDIPPKLAGGTAVLLTLLAVPAMLLVWVAPHLALRDLAVRGLLEAQLAVETGSSQVWTEHYQTGSCCATLYGMALVPSGQQPPAGVDVFHIVGDEVWLGDGTLEGARYDPDCYSCFPRSIASALLANPEHEVWTRTADAAWFD